MTLFDFQRLGARPPETAPCVDSGRCALAAYRLCGDCAGVPRTRSAEPQGPGQAHQHGQGAGVALAIPVRLREGQVVYRADQRGDSVLVLRRGLVKEVLPLGQAERIVRLVGPGGMTGFAALAGEPHRHSAVAVGEGEACRIPAEQLRRAIEHEEKSPRALFALWQAALDDMDLVIGRFAFGPAQSRLARYVLFMVDRQAECARLRRRDAAELLGITPVSVTRLISRFKREGLIEEQGGRLVACDRARLADMAHDRAAHEWARPPLSGSTNGQRSGCWPG